MHKKRALIAFFGDNGRQRSEVQWDPEDSFDCVDIANFATRMYICTVGNRNNEILCDICSFTFVTIRYVESSDAVLQRSAKGSYNYRRCNTRELCIGM